MMPITNAMPARRVQRDGARYLVQDLKSGERHEFDSEAQLRRFITERGVMGLR